MNELTILLQYIGDSCIGQIMLRVSEERYRKLEKYNQANPQNRVMLTVMPPRPNEKEMHFQMVVSANIPFNATPRKIRETMERAAVKAEKSVNNTLSAMGL